MKFSAVQSAKEPYNLFSIINNVGAVQSNNIQLF